MRDNLHKSGTAVLSCWMDFTPDGHIQWLCTTGFDIWYNPWQSRKVAFINMTAISFVLWASYQICKIAGCACAGNAGNVSPRRQIQRKLLVSDPGIHHGTCVTHVPWCMSGSLTHGGGENVPGIPGACASAILRIWQEAHGDTFEGLLKETNNFST